MVDYTKLRKKLIPDQDGEPATHLRTGVVDAVNADGTVDLLMASGVVIPGVSRLSSAYVVAGDVVQVISLRGSMLVIGTVLGLTPGQRVETTIRTSNSSAIGHTTETTIDSVTASLVTGRTYRVRWVVGLLPSAANTAFIRLREDSVSGTQIQIARVNLPFIGGSGSRVPATIEAEYTAVSSGNKTFVGTLLTITTDLTTTVQAAPTYPVYLYVDYIHG